MWLWKSCKYTLHFKFYGIKNKQKCYFHYVIIQKAIFQSIKNLNPQNRIKWSSGNIIIIVFFSLQFSTLTQIIYLDKLRSLGSAFVK